MKVRRKQQTCRCNMTNASSPELTLNPTCQFHLNLPPACSASLCKEPAFVFIHLFIFVSAAGWSHSRGVVPSGAAWGGSHFLWLPALSPGEVFQVCPAQTQNLLEGLHFPSGPWTPLCCLSDPDGRAGERMGFTSDLAQVFGPKC